MIIAITGWKFSFDELCEKLEADKWNYACTADFEEKFCSYVETYMMNEICWSTDYNSIDCDYIFGIKVKLSDNYEPQSVNPEHLYFWFKDMKHKLMENNSNYYPFEGIPAEPKLYIISQEW